MFRIYCGDQLERSPTLLKVLFQFLGYTGLHVISPHHSAVWHLSRCSRRAMAWFWWFASGAHILAKFNGLQQAFPQMDDCSYIWA